MEKLPKNSAENFYISFTQTHQFLTFCLILIISLSSSPLFISTSPSLSVSDYICRDTLFLLDHLKLNRSIFLFLYLLHQHVRATALSYIFVVQLLKSRNLKLIEITVYNPILSVMLVISFVALFPLQLGSNFLTLSKPERGCISLCLIHTFFQHMCTGHLLLPSILGAWDTSVKKTKILSFWTLYISI